MPPVASCRKQWQSVNQSMLLQPQVQSLHVCMETRKAFDVPDKFNKKTGKGEEKIIMPDYISNHKKTYS